MPSVDFELKPFEPADHLTITGKASRKKDTLTIRYHLTGDLSQIAVPTIGTGGTRQDRLWEKTCFEFFLMPHTENKSSTTELTKETIGNYWEFNLSPNGDWNVFSLNSYRQALQEEKAFSALPFEAWQGFQGLQLEAAIDLSKLVKAKQSLLLNVSAVVVSKEGKETFWAIAHPGPEADFHHPKSFILTL